MLYNNHQNVRRFTMYNIDQKSQFIEYVLVSCKGKDIKTKRSSLINFFNRLEEIENELEKDFAEFNYEEIKIALSVLCKRSVNYQRSILSQLRQYIEWAIDLNISKDSENRLIGITTDDIDFSISYKFSMVKDEDQLVENLDLVLNPMKNDTIHNMYRGIFHLLFNGVNLKEALELKNADVDLINKKAYINERCIDLSNTCCSILGYLSKMSGFAIKENRLKGDFLEITDTGHVLERTVDNRDSMEQSLRPKISGFMGELKELLKSPISITPNTLLISGIFSRMYKKEIETKEIDFSEYMSKNEYKVSTIDNPEAILEEGMIGYHAWKKAFGLK